MLSRVQVVRPLSRSLATLAATEKFAIPAVTLNPTTPSMPSVKQASLSNGIRLVTRDTGVTSGNVAVTVAVLGGSSVETVESKGAAQLLAASALIGTAKRSDIKLTRDLEHIGAKLSINADREKITYNLTVPSENVEAAMSVVGEVIVNPPKATYLLKENKAAVAIRNSNSNNLLNDVVFETAYGASPLGNSVGIDNMNELCVDEVMKYRNSVFTSNNIVVTSNGIVHDKIKQLVECYLHGLPTGTSTVGKSSYVGGYNRVKVSQDSHHDDDSTTVSIAFPVPTGAHSAPYSVIYNSLAKKFQHSGSIQPFCSIYSAGGLLGFYIDASDASTVSAKITTCINALKASTNANVATALNSKLSLEGTTSATNELLNQVITGSVDHKAVTNDQVKGAINAMLGSKVTYAVVGSKSTPTYDAVAALCK